MAQTVPKLFAAELRRWPAQQQSQPVVAASLPAMVLLVAAAVRVVVLPAVSRSQRCWELTLDQLLDPCFAEAQQSLGSSR